MSVTTTQPPVVLEPASQEFVEATAKPPFLYELTPAEARKVLDDVQAAPIDKLAVEDRWITVPAEVGDVRVRIVRPPDATGALPVILYMHGGGWVLGNADTHDRLVRELAVGTGAAVVFVEYERSPEAHYPVAIEQGYATAQWIVREGAANQLDPERIAVAGDSVGGNMTAALALMADERGDVRFVQQSMYYPVTDAGMDTGSYEQFAEGYFLTAKAMEWFWDAYAPDVEVRSEPFASPLRAQRRAARRAPACVPSRRRGGCPSGRGRGLRGPSAGGWSRGDDRPLRRDHPRFHDAQPAQRHACDTRCNRAGHLRCCAGRSTASQETAMHEIKVVTISAEEAEHGVAELWAGDQQIAYTVLDDGELKLRRFVPRRDGTPGGGRRAQPDRGPRRGRRSGVLADHDMPREVTQ